MQGTGRMAAVQPATCHQALPAASCLQAPPRSQSAPQLEAVEDHVPAAQEAEIPEAKDRGVSLLFMVQLQAGTMLLLGKKEITEVTQATDRSVGRLSWGPPR